MNYALYWHKFWHRKTHYKRDSEPTPWTMHNPLKSQYEMNKTKPKHTSAVTQWCKRAEIARTNQVLDIIWETRFVSCGQKRGIWYRQERLRRVGMVWNCCTESLPKPESFWESSRRIYEWHWETKHKRSCSRELRMFRHEQWLCCCRDGCVAGGSGCPSMKPCPVVAVQRCPSVGGYAHTEFWHTR